MTTEIEEFRESLVAAVQAELQRHASAVVAEVDRLREENQRERAEMRSEFTAQLSTIAQALEQVQARSDSQQEKSRSVFDQRLDESEARQTRRLEDMVSGLEGLVQAVTRPLAQELKDDQAALGYRVEGLDSNLRKFDEQAARMVTYFNDVTQRVETRQDELADTLKNDIAQEVDTVKKLVEENDSVVRRVQGEMTQAISQRIGDAEDRFNNRLLAAETRVKDDAGEKIAEIDAHVGRVSSGLDDTMGVLNDRLASYDERFVASARQIEELEAAVAGIDQSSLDELKEKMSTAAGEAMLVRIEMERLEKTVNERGDGLAVRLTEVETQLIDATMDVSTAVQLDRLEEIERALIEINPEKFVLKDEDSRADEYSGAEQTDSLADGM
jgi:uncharacterized protein YicC (UPF0701 family)